MTKSFNPNPKCKRTKDGLLAHHKKEDTMISLSNPKIAKSFPFEWQSKENIIYCDYLEHLLLHILICKYPSDEKNNFVGFGGIVDHLVPELNDLYSGWETIESWRKNCHDKVKNDKDVYIEMLKQFIENEKDDANFDVSILCRSYNERYGKWTNEKNSKLYKEITALI